LLTNNSLGVLPILKWSAAVTPNGPKVLNLLAACLNAGFSILSKDDINFKLFILYTLNYIISLQSNKPPVIDS